MVEAKRRGMAGHAWGETEERTRRPRKLLETYSYLREQSGSLLEAPQTWNGNAPRSQWGDLSLVV